ncbi:hypothetical protein M153_8590002260 [Pseudoloma neurophilia]|uniref:CCHC-type domain-containing protein n=1 Tax=Pseudoloma neurophilia TaxID=146866 RepID=A0A0R0M342_9MICR|nr:hypothetical protein M153_8590002260 [Pseudoloma neurophilia]
MRIEYEKFSKEKLAQEKVELEKKNEDLEREVRFTKMRMSGFSQERRKQKCYRCGELGHISRFCNLKEVNGKFEYSGNSSFEKRGKIRHLEIISGIPDLDDLIESFLYSFLNLDRPVEFYPIEMFN